jgi:type VI protein secretion system component VasF
MTEFERNARAVLEQSIARLDGRTRSRLNQARQRAIEAAATRHRPGWRSYALMPAGAMAAAVLVTVMLWHRAPLVHEPPQLEGHVTAVEDLDLLADAEGLDLMEEWDNSGFYEWAADQTDGNVQSDG